MMPCKNKCSAWKPTWLFKNRKQIPMFLWWGPIEGWGQSPSTSLLDLTYCTSAREKVKRWVQFNPSPLNMLNAFKCFHNMRNNMRIMWMISTSKQFFDRPFEILLVSMKTIFSRNETIVPPEAIPATGWTTQSHYIHYVQVQHWANLAHQCCPFLPPGEGEQGKGQSALVCSPMQLLQMWRNLHLPKGHWPFIPGMAERSTSSGVQAAWGRLRKPRKRGWSG